MDVKEIQDSQEVRFAANFQEIETISKIDSCSFYNHYRKEHVERVLRDKKAFALVVLENQQLVGFVLYYVDKNHYIICRMAVHPDYRKKGYGKMLLNVLCSKLSPLKKHVDIVLKESNVGAQQFFKSLNFNAIKIHKNYFTTYHDDLPVVPYIEDGILFRRMLD